MTRWTDEQRAAIEARGSNLLLSAAAGSGKTAVLVERVLRLVAEEGADVDRMLVVTFTRAAAAEMRARLSHRLGERAAAGDARCREQMIRLERASITTIHAFCADFLRTNFESAGVDPAFRVLDDAIAGRLRDEALDEALEEAYAGAESPGDDDGADVPAAYRPDEGLRALDYGRGPSGVRAAVEILLRHMEERPDPEAWLARASACDEGMLSLWQDELKRAARRSIANARVQLVQALRVPDCPAHYEAAIRQDIAALDAIGEIDEYDALHRALSEFKPTAARAGRGAGGDPEATETVKRLRDAAKRALGEAKLIDLPLLTAREDARRLSGQISTLSDIARRASALYGEKKAAQAGLTYADLEHKTLAAVRNPEAARAVRERFDYIFIDEYQDTSDLQEALMAAICRPDNRFMVGDVKQSIYRFRLAEPRLFLEKYEAYKRGEGGRLLPLTRNFRSRRGILDFVNMVFERAMTGGDSEIEYDALARLNPGDPDEPAAEVPDVAIHLIDRAAGAEEPGEDESRGEAGENVLELKAVEREGVLIAREIRRMMAEDPSLRFRDFAILTRSKAEPFAAMMPILLAAGIPAYADGAAGFFDSMEISWTLSVLRLVDNPRSDVELIGALRSPAGGLDADALARVRIAWPDVPYCDAAAAYAREMDDDIAVRLRSFFAMADQWRLKAGSVALGELLRTILEDSGFYTYVGALPGGAQRQANLDQLVAAADGFDRDNSGSLTRFLRYTEHLRARGDGDAAHLLSESDDVVRMMTVHKSKGLEFPVVFGAQLARRYRVEKRSAPLVAHRDLGVGMMYVDSELRTRRVTLPQAAIIERGRREDAAEELRILYVLLTRAKRRLVLVGTARDAGREMKKWQALSGAPFAATSHLDVVMAARCAAEAAGEDARSTLDIHASDALARGAALGGEAGGDARALLEAIEAAPERYADEALEAELAWRYPDPLSSGQPLKLTASGLIRELEGPEQVPALIDRPQFMAEAERDMTGAERGTAYHRAMQLIDLAAVSGLSGRALAEAVARQLDGFAEARLMTRAQRDAVRSAPLAAFLDSEIGRALRAAKTVRREWPFNVRLHASEALTPEEAGRFGDAELLVQGTVDCCFEVDGGWVLMDYKTDRTGDLDALRAHYEKQLRVYAIALERITGMPVSRRALCLISQNRVLDL